MATSSNLKNQKMHRTNMKKLRKQKKKEAANRREKKQQQVAQQVEQTILIDHREPKEIIDKIAEVANVKVLTKVDHEEYHSEATKPVSAARRAFQDV